MSSSFSHWPPGHVEALEAAGCILRTWGDGYGYALVATGRAAAMVDPAVEPYDIGPMPVIFEESGGRFTDLAGDAGIEGGSGIASNGALHDQLLARLAP
jgi:fructose-1,6-bisphosphatase/inositol monophosphatase family enzyme